MKQRELDELRHRLNYRTEGYMAFNDFVFEKITSEEVIVSLQPKKELLNPLNKVHGGAIFGLADTAAGILCFADDRPSVTLKGSMDYLKEVGMTKIYAKARYLNKTYRTSVGEVRVEGEDGTLYAYGVYNFYRVKREIESEGQ